MPHVSPKKVGQKLLKKISAQFLNVFIKSQNNRQLASIFNEIFTPTEKIMFSKRIAIILMIKNSIPHHRIAEILKVSQTTVAKISLGVELEKYNSIISVSKKEKLDLEKLVWILMTAGGILPPRAGKKYWMKYSKS